MAAETTEIRDWLLRKLTPLAHCSHVLVRDGARLLPDADSTLHSFARQHGYTVISASTNLVFRELYEEAIADPEVRKLLVIDRAPNRRRERVSPAKAPPPFYPDLLEVTPPEARIEVDLRAFLQETTGDPTWPRETNDPRYAALIARHLPGVLQAHSNLRAADPARFTDHDLQQIVAFAALGVGDSAFKRLDADDYWKVGLLGHEALRELDDLAPEVTGTVKDALERAPAPFCWFARRDPDAVIRAFYLTVILAQHVESWQPLLAAIDPTLATLTAIEPRTLDEAAAKLVELDPDQAQRDLEEVEADLGAEALQRLLIEGAGLSAHGGFAAVIEQERYSTLVRSLALLLAVHNALLGQPAQEEHRRLQAVLFPGTAAQSGASTSRQGFVEQRPSTHWTTLREAYRLAGEIAAIRKELHSFLRGIRPKKPVEISFAQFRDMWNGKRVNRLEYCLSALKRLVETGDLLPLPAAHLPEPFAKAPEAIRKNLQAIATEVQGQLEEINRFFQLMVASRYPGWVGASDGEVVLTSQFIGRCLARHWDPQKERAVVFVFDGMRYDIWDEMVRPLFEASMTVIDDLPAISLLPSATRYSRWAIAAGSEPAAFWPPRAENDHLKAALRKELRYEGAVSVADPGSAGTGETVRYRAENLDYYIFEVCDKELHKIARKEMPDGRIEPARPLAFIYEQHVKSIIDNEVMHIVRRLEPGTKVFVVADHGFGPVGGTKLWFDGHDLNDRNDCSYLYAKLNAPFIDAAIPQDKRAQMLAFTPAQLRLPASVAQSNPRANETWTDHYGAYVFPKVGHAFSRPSSPFKPDYYSHGGISLQELMIPMVVLQVKAPREGLLSFDAASGPAEVVEGQEIEVRARLSARPRGGMFEEIRAEVEASYSRGGESAPLPRQVLYVSAQGIEVAFRFKPDVSDATDEERKGGRMERVLAIAATARDGRRAGHAAQSHRFTVLLNTERLARRVPAGLGTLLGMMPKNER